MEKRTALLIGGGVVLIVGGYLIYRHEKNASGISGSGSAGAYSGLPVVTTTFKDNAGSGGLPILYGAPPGGSSGATSGGGGGGGATTQPTTPMVPSATPSAQPSAGGHAGKLASFGSGSGASGAASELQKRLPNVTPTPTPSAVNTPPPNPALETGPNASGGYTPSAVQQSYPTAPTNFPFTTIFTGSNGTVYYGLGNEDAVRSAEAAGYTITNAQAAGVPGGTTKAKYAYK